MHLHHVSLRAGLGAVPVAAPITPHNAPDSGSITQATHMLTGPARYAPYSLMLKVGASIHHFVLTVLCETYEV